MTGSDNVWEGNGKLWRKKFFWNFQSNLGKWEDQKHFKDFTVQSMPNHEKYRFFLFPDF